MNRVFQAPYPVICLAGPTATGKTDLALALVQRFPLEIISVDSALVYRGLNIGTAKPAPAVLAHTTHHLIDICEIMESYSAARFCQDVAALIPAILARGKVPLLVGGTMLYFHALINGLSELPPANPAIREAILVEAQKHGWDSLYHELERVDPQAAARIHPNDPQRLQRALEVYRLTGQPLSAWQGARQAIPLHALWISLMPEDRTLLHQRIDTRFEQMLDAGFITEVRDLCEYYPVHADLPAMRSVGYRQALAYLAGTCSYTKFVADAKTATRQLAKRQMTWLRQSFSSDLSVDPWHADPLTVLSREIQTWLANKPA